MKVYIRRNFNKREVVAVDSSKLKLSPFFPKPMRSALREQCKKIMLPSHYILCPVYNTGDVQIGITGTAEKGEKPYQSMARELGEEVGLLPKSAGHLKYLSGGTYRSKHSVKTQIVFAINIKDTQPLLDSQHMVSVSKGKDDKSRKVGCFVYGTEKAMVEYIAREKIYRYKDFDNIVGLAVVNASDIMTRLGTQ